MGRTRELLKKIGDTKGTFCAKMSTIKDKNGKDLTETEEIKKRGQEYIEELYKNFFFFLSKRKHFIFIIQNIIQQHVVTLLITKVFLNAQKTD